MWRYCRQKLANRNRFYLHWRTNDKFVFYQSTKSLTKSPSTERVTRRVWRIRRSLPGSTGSTRTAKGLAMAQSTSSAIWRQVISDIGKVISILRICNHNGHLNVWNEFQGLTSVRHDAEKYTEVENCDDPGCYSRNITYDVTMRQMISLAELSRECHQSIRVLSFLYLSNSIIRTNILLAILG